MTHLNFEASFVIGVYNTAKSMSTHASHPCCGSKPWYQKKVWWVVTACFAFGAAFRAFPRLEPLAGAFWDYVGKIFWPVTLGLVIGGMMDRYVPKEYVSRLLARPRKRTVFYAAGLGLLASACSHGILALSMELHKKGASGPAVISFLLASPWANFPVTLLLVGLFGWKGFLIILAALLVAINTGLILQRLDQRGWIEKNRNTVAAEGPFSVRLDFGKRIRNYRFSWKQAAQDIVQIGRSTVTLCEMVLGWVTFGVLLASLAQAYVPAHWFHTYLGPGLGGLLVTLGIATILEVCSEGTAPLAFEIYRNTQALGNSFVFLTAGVLTDYTEIGLVWQNVGRKTALWMVLAGVPQILILGYLFNRIF